MKMLVLNINLHAFGEGMGHRPSRANRPEGQGEPSERPTFDALIRGEYKQDFTNRVSAILDRRLKSVNAELTAARKVLSLLRQRYGIEDGPNAAEAVRRALEQDDAYWGSAAEELGMTPAQYRRMAKAEADSKELRAMLAAQETMQRKKDLFRQWDAQAKEFQEEYPDIDPREEMARNPDFADLVRRGVDMLTAYQVCHQKESIRQAARQAEDQTAARFRANRSRPAENGAFSNQPVRLRTDPSKWTREQFRDIERRAARGERIVL